MAGDDETERLARLQHAEAAGRAVSSGPAPLAAAPPELTGSVSATTPRKTLAPPAAPPPGGSIDGKNATIEDPRVTDLSAFHGFASFERRVEGEFSKVRKLVKAIHGTVYLYKWERAGQEPITTVVKAMPTQAVHMNQGRETSELQAHLAERGAVVPEGSPHSPCTRERIPHQEDALNEIGVISYLTRQPDCPRYLLRMIDSFVQNDQTWLITEHADGGEFFEQVSSRSTCWSEERNRSYMWQLLHAVRYLHHHDIGHRDISLENILITYRRDPPGGERMGELRLMDFGGSCRTRLRPGAPLCRYFRPVGKAYYRAPECVVPAALETQVIVPRGATASSVIFTKLAREDHRGYVCEVLLPAEAAPEQRVTAQMMGYTVPAMDTFACGVCLFIIVWGIPPWQSARLQDQLFNFIASRGDRGLRALLGQWKKPELTLPGGMDLLIKMLRPAPATRPSIEECLASDWFLGLINEAVPVHDDG